MTFSPGGIIEYGRHLCIYVTGAVLTAAISWLDLKIIALTIWKIMKREGISQPGHATAEEFKGGCKSKPLGV